MLTRPDDVSDFDSEQVLSIILDTLFDFSSLACSTGWTSIPTQRTIRLLAFSTRTTATTQRRAVPRPDCARWSDGSRFECHSLILPSLPLLLLPSPPSADSRLDVQEAQAVAKERERIQDEFPSCNSQYAL